MKLLSKMLNDSITQSFFNYGIRKIVSPVHNDYKEVVDALNSLQTNANVLQMLKKTAHINGIQKINFENTLKYLNRTGITLDHLEKNLPIIHVAGTKGKGSTCAYCESILRYNGYKTGFFSSPHIIAVRERIRIDGRPLTETQFSKHFWNVYNKLKQKQDDEYDMPPYFKFLMVMAFNVFLTEKVDVAVIEVGIGGEYDCTNVVTKVPVVGITSLGLDHVSLLGDTIEKIAWQKAGIMKNGAVTFTSAEQPGTALEVLKQRAQEKNSTLFEAPPLEAYDWKGKDIDLSLQGSVQRLNASLALQLSNAWILLQENKDKTKAIKEIQGAAKGFVVSSASSMGLKHCKWPGRNQILEQKKSMCSNTFFLDGAHTTESIKQCVEWFLEASKARSDKARRILVFNATGDRDDAQLMDPFFYCNFHSVFFCPNVATTKLILSADQKNMNVTTDEQLTRCKNNVNLWKNIERNKGVYTAQHVTMYPTALDALTFIESTQQDQHVLITGSLHLIGAVLQILDPDLSISYNTPFLDLDSR